MSIGDPTYTVKNLQVSNTGNSYSFQLNGVSPGHLISTGSPWASDGSMFTMPTCSPHMAGELYEYVDGTIFVHCQVCKQRIQLSAIPAWGAPEQLAVLVEHIMAGEADSELALQEILTIKEKLEVALEQIVEAQALIEIATRLALGINSDH